MQKDGIYKKIHAARESGKFIAYNKASIPDTVRNIVNIGTLPDGRQVFIGEFIHDIATKQSFLVAALG